MDFINYFKSLRSGDYQNDNFKAFLKKVGFSFNVPSIHIAGTNGKGSTANYLASYYKNSGLLTGLFISPYLFKYNEMISVNGQNISDEEFESIVNEYAKFIEKYDLSEFEVQTFVALTYFSRKNCDIAIIECGMGGELDATNIFNSIASVITSIGIEHGNYLGRSISEISYHKGGIIKEKSPVIVGNLNEEAKDVIYSIAKDNNSKFYAIVEPNGIEANENGYTFNYLNFKNVSIKSKALYSVYDACIALETINCLAERFPINDEAIRNGFFEVNMECRMDVLSTKPLIVVDGAHNPDGMNALKKSLLEKDIQDLRVIFACFKDKNFQSMLSSIGEIANEIVLTTFDNPRARGIEDYFLFADDYRFNENPVNAIKEMIESHPDSFILVTGSLAFAAYMKDKFNKKEIL